MINNNNAKILNFFDKSFDEKDYKFCRNNDCLLIDCRDFKKNDFEFDLRFSLDGFFSIIDCTKSGQINTTSNYTFPKNISSISLACMICIKFIESFKYEEKKIYYYDLNKNELPIYIGD